MLDKAAILREMEQLSPQERIEFAMAVWDHSVTSGAEPELTKEQTDELDRRLIDIEQYPDDWVDWETIKATFRK